MRWVWEKGMSYSCCLCLYLPRRRWHPPNYFASVNMEAVEIVSPCSTARILSQTSVNIILRLFLPFWAVHCFGLSPMDLLVIRISLFLCLLTRDDAVWRYRADHYWWLLPSSLLQSMAGQLLGWTGQYIEVGGCWGEMRCGRRERWFRWLRLQQEVATALLPAGLENLQFISQYMHTVHYTQHLLSWKVSGLQIRFSAQKAF